MSGFRRRSVLRDCLGEGPSHLSSSPRLARSLVGRLKPRWAVLPKQALQRWTLWERHDTLAGLSVHPKFIMFPNPTLEFYFHSFNDPSFGRYSLRNTAYGLSSFELVPDRDFILQHHDFVKLHPALLTEIQSVELSLQSFINETARLRELATAFIIDPQGQCLSIL